MVYLLRYTLVWPFRYRLIFLSCLSLQSRPLGRVTVYCVDGQRYCVGDVDIPFLLQSGSWPINYALTANDVRPDVRLGTLKLQDWTLTDDFAGVDIAGLDIA